MPNPSGNERFFMNWLFKKAEIPLTLLRFITSNSPVIEMPSREAHIQVLPNKVINQKLRNGQITDYF
jgi:hypothetical protein